MTTPVAERAEGLGSRSAVMFAAFAVDRALGFLLIVLITRWWSPTEVGFWTQSVAFTGALATIASMGLYQAHIRFAEESAEPRIRHSLQLTILSVTTGGLLIAAIVAAAIPGPFSRTVFGVDTETRLLAAVFALAMSELWAEFVIVQLRAEIDARGAALVMGGKAVLRVLLVGAFALTGHDDVSKAVLALAVVQWLAATAVILMRFGGRHWIAAGLAPSRGLFGRALRMALPMIPAAVAAQAYVTIERFSLARLQPSSIAHFSIGQQFASNATMAYVILGSMFYPMLVRAWRDGKAGAVSLMVSDILVMYAVVSVPAIVVLPLVSRELIPLLTTQYYQVSASSFLALTIGAAGLGVHQLAGAVFYVRERTWELLALFVVGFLAKLLCAATLISAFGERGAVFTSAIGGIVLAGATLVRARRLIPFDFQLRRIWRIAAASLAAAAPVAAVRFWSDDASSLLILSVAALGLASYALMVRAELRRLAHPNPRG